MGWGTGEWECCWGLGKGWFGIEKFIPPVPAFIPFSPGWAASSFEPIFSDFWAQGGAPSNLGARFSLAGGISRDVFFSYLNNFSAVLVFKNSTRYQRKKWVAASHYCTDLATHHPLATHATLKHTRVSTHSFSRSKPLYSNPGHPNLLIARSANQN